MVELEIHVQFQPVMQYAWPGGMGGQYLYWDGENRAFILSESRGERNAIIGSPWATEASAHPAHRLAEAPSTFTIPWFEEFPYAYYHADTTPFWMLALWNYWRASGDDDLIRELWPFITGFVSWAQYRYRRPWAGFPLLRALQGLTFDFSLGRHPENLSGAYYQTMDATVPHPRGPTGGTHLHPVHPLGGLERPDGGEPGRGGRASLSARPPKHHYLPRDLRRYRSCPENPSPEAGAPRN